MAESNLAIEADELVSQLDKIRTVLGNIEEKKGSVRPAIYEKLRGEYLAKLDGLRDRVQPLLDRIRGDLQELAEKEAALSDQKDALDLELEELNFRLEVGDIPTDDHDARREELNGQLEEIGGQLAEIGDKVTELNALASRLQINDLTDDGDDDPRGGGGGGGGGRPLDEAIVDASELDDDGFETRSGAADKGADSGPWDLGEELVGDRGDDEDEEEAADDEDAGGEEDEAEDAGEPERPERAAESGAWEKEFFGEEVEPGSEPDNGAGEATEFGRFRILQGVNSGTIYELSDSEIKVGRDLDNHIQILDPKISRHHFVVERRKRAYLLRDRRAPTGPTSTTAASTRSASRTATKSASAARSSSSSFRADPSPRPGALPF